MIQLPYQMDDAQPDSAEWRLQKNLEALRLAMGERAKFGPYTAAGASQLAGAEQTVVVTHSLNLTDPTKFVVSGYLFDGNYAAECTWRAILGANTATIIFFAGGTHDPTPNLRFLIEGAG